MRHRFINASTRRRPAVLAIGLVTAAAFALLPGACAEPASPTAAEFAQPSVAPAANAIISVGDELARLRSATARFHDIEAATAAEYSIALTGCMTDPTLGGMGFHFGKGSAINTKAVNPLEPEVLLYEPESNGRLRLVAVEYIVPYELQPRNGPAPVAFGQSFKQNDVFGVWALHAWVWKNNPSGMFADWNPNVSCDAVPAASRMSHSTH